MEMSFRSLKKYQQRHFPQPFSHARVKNLNAFDMQCKTHGVFTSPVGRGSCEAQPVSKFYKRVNAFNSLAVSIILIPISIVFWYRWSYVLCYGQIRLSFKPRDSHRILEYPNTNVIRALEKKFVLNLYSERISNECRSLVDGPGEDVVR